MVGDALRAVGVVAVDEPMTADQAKHGARELRRLLAAMQTIPFTLYVKATQSVTLTTAISYTLSTRAVRILQVNFNNGDSELPMYELTRDEYDRLPVKDTAGIPTQYYVDQQQNATVIKVWPGLATVDDEVLTITYERETEDPTEEDDTFVDIPREWESAVMYQLAVRLAAVYGVDPSRIAAIASGDFAQAMAADREGSVFFAGNDE